MELIKSIGLMSGTSMDGIDAALIITDGQHHCERLGHTHINYDKRFSKLLHALSIAIHLADGDLAEAETIYEQSLINYLHEHLFIPKLALNSEMRKILSYFDNIASLNQEKSLFKKIIYHSTFLHVEAAQTLLQTTGYRNEGIDIVGYHGQTVYHKPEKKVTLQLGYPEILAEELRIPVIHNFRYRDVAFGGQGAPLAPLYHQALAANFKTKLPVAFINCGGIANISYIYGEEANQIIGFDTGPGNCMLDNFVRQKTQGSEVMDKNGNYGLGGKINQKALQKLLDSFQNHKKDNLTTLYPKSLDSGDFALPEEIKDLGLNDGCATLAAFTAETIATSSKILPKNPKLWVLSGGGWLNKKIHLEFTQRIKQHLNRSVTIKSANDLGLNSQSIEAETFAYLAVRSLKGMPISMPNITQAPRPLCGGIIKITSHENLPEYVSYYIAKNPRILTGYKLPNE